MPKENPYFRLYEGEKVRLSEAVTGLPALKGRAEIERLFERGKLNQELTSDGQDLIIWLKSADGDVAA